MPIDRQRNKELREYIAQQISHNIVTSAMVPKNDIPHHHTKIQTPNAPLAIADMVFTKDALTFVHRKTGKAVITITDDEIIIGCIDGEHIKLEIK